MADRRRPQQGAPSAGIQDVDAECLDGLTGQGEVLPQVDDVELRRLLEVDLTGFGVGLTSLAIGQVYREGGAQVVAEVV